MPAAVVQLDSSRYDDMDATTNTTNIGGGAGESAEPEIVYQGTASIARKVSGGSGFYSDTGANRDLTSAGRRTWIVKTWLSNYGSLNNGGFVEIRLGSGTGAYNPYSIANNVDPAYPDYPPKGGWIIQAIDPSVAAFLTASGRVGTPNSASTSLFGVFASCSVSKELNLALDAIDVGVGMFLISGGNGSAAGTFEDFIAVDEDDITDGRAGYVTTRDDVIFTLGRLIIGASSSNGTRTEEITVFEDSNKTVVFSENYGAPRFSGLTFDLAASGTTISLTSMIFDSKGTSSAGIAAPFSDNRAVAEIFGANSGSFSAESCTFNNFADIAGAGSSSFEACNFNQLANFHLSGATLSNCTIKDHPTTTGISCVKTDNLALISNTIFDNTDGDGHAIEIEAAGTYSFVGNSFVGYGDTASLSASIFNDTGGIVVINVTGGGDSPTYRNGAGADTQVSASVEVTLSPVVNDSEVRVFLGFKTDPTNAVEIAGVESTSGGEFVFTHGNPASDAYIVITKEDYEHEILVLALPSTDTTIPVSQRFDRNYSNPP